MKSSNPYSGCRAVEVAKTLDTTDPNPCKNQGGIAVVAFAQNQRDEVRDLGDKAGSLQAQPGVKQQTFILDSIGGQAERGWEGEVAPTLKAVHYKFPPSIAVGASAGFCTEHSAKSRSVGYAEQTSPTLISRMETATGTTQDNLPICAPVLASKDTVYCLQGNGIDRAETAGCNGKGWKADASYTLNTIDRHAVAYDGANVTSPINKANPKLGDPCHTLSTDGRNYVVYSINQQGGSTEQILEGRTGTLTAAMNSGNNKLSVAYDDTCCTMGGFMQVTEEVSPTLFARDWKDPTCVCTQYIVRRLTPTECARLQGFPDRWGDIGKRNSFTPEEYEFWLGVRNTHATINGKKAQDYTEAQMLTWYNKLHTDSAEYKMWGNGIALPPALYVMQGIADSLTAEDDDWMN